MTPGLVAGLEDELRALRKSFFTAPSHGRVRGRGILVMASGVGPVRAGVAARRLLENGAGALISWGSAGALDRALLPGCLLLPTYVLGTDKTVFPVDRSWHERLFSTLSDRVPIDTGPLSQSAVIIANARQKRRLRETQNAVAVDMESATLAEIAARSGVPFIVIRVITDTADMGIPGSVTGAINHRGRVNLARLFFNLALRPQDWLALHKLGRNFKAAQKTLEAVVEHAGVALLAPPIVREVTW